MLIFVLFVVDLAVTKFSHPRKLKPTVICESMMMGVAKNIVAVIQLMASSTLIFFYLKLFVQVSADMTLVLNKEDRERDRARVSITSSLVQCHAPGLVAVTKFKTTKINSEGLL